MLAKLGPDLRQLTLAEMLAVTVEPIGIEQICRLGPQCGPLSHWWFSQVDRGFVGEQSVADLGATDEHGERVFRSVNLGDRSFDHGAVHRGEVLGELLSYGT